MHLSSLVCLFTLVLAAGSDCASPPQDSQAGKLKEIRLLQDQRRGAGSPLLELLSDGDPVVREHALLASGSIQDTLLLPVIMECLHDAEPRVREAAAFAVGQSGLVFSPAGRASLERQCLALWASGEVSPRLLEELGKFGSKDALARYMSLLRGPAGDTTRSAMIMGIARFAIRGITDGPVTRWLLGLARQPDKLSWQIVYALQRIAPAEVIDPSVVRPLAAHRDPLVRMNTATLLGKTRDSLGGPRLLLELAARDVDWRVRVNAVRALGMFGPPLLDSLLQKSGEVDTRFVELFQDENEHVALTALATFGEMMKGATTIPARAENILWAIAESRVSKSTDRRRAEAFGALAKSGGAEVFARLSRVRPANEWMESRLLTALGAAGDTAALVRLQKKAEAKSPLVATAALEGLRQLVSSNKSDRRVLDVATVSAIRALGSNDVAVLTTAAGMLEDSLLTTPRAVEPLLRALERLKEPDDTEAMQQVIHTLGVLKDRRAVPLLERLLGNPDRTVAVAAADALHNITGTPGPLPAAPERGNALGRDGSGTGSPRPDTVLVRMRTSAGTVVLELYHHVAPYTVESFLRLVNERKFYDGLVFHRVVPNFVVQGGDPRGDGWGGPGYAIRSEFSLLRYERGMLGMASAGKDTEGSQFFITHSPQPHLDGRYTIFGRVRSGMDVVDRLHVGDRIETVRLERRDPKDRRSFR